MTSSIKPRQIEERQTEAQTTSSLRDCRSGFSYPLGRSETYLGRDPQNTIVLAADKLVSRKHSVIRYEDGCFILQDLASKHGVLLNGRSISGPVRLNSGDRISIGLTQMIFLNETSSIATELHTLPNQCPGLLHMALQTSKKVLSDIQSFFRPPAGKALQN